MSHLRTLLLSLVAIVFFLIVYQTSVLIYSKSADFKSLAIKIEKTFQQHQLELDKQINFLKQYLYQHFNVNQEEKFQLFKSLNLNNDYHFFILNYDSLIFWTSYQINVESILPIEQKQNGIIQIPQGFFYLSYDTIKNYTIIGLLPIYYQYPYNNKYFPEGFSQFLKAHSFISNASISFDEKSDYRIFDSSNNYAFSIVFQNTENVSFLYWISFLAFVCVICSLILIIYQLLFYVTKRIYLSFFLTIFLTIFIRAVQIVHRWPKFLYDNDLFYPVYYAWNEWFSSFGDYLINVSIITFLIVILFKKREQAYIYIKNPSKKLTLVFLFSLLFIAYILFCYYLIFSVIVHSPLKLSLSNIFNWTIYELLAYISILLIVTTLVLSGYPLIIFLKRNLRKISEKWLFLLFYFAFAIFISYAFHNSILFAILTFIIFFSAILIRKFTPKTSFFLKLILILFSTFFATYTYIYSQKKKEKDFESLFIIQLTTETDPIVEFLIEDINERFNKDTFFLNLLSEYKVNSDKIAHYIITNYFQEYFSKYQIQITSCFENDSLLLVDNNVKVKCLNFFETIKHQYCKPTSLQNLWRLEQASGRPGYLLELKHYNNHYRQNNHIYIEILSSARIAATGYPELLIDDKYQSLQLITDYKYAKYYQDQLIFQKGNFQYPLTLNKTTKNWLENDKNFMHNIYVVDDNTKIILSKAYLKTVEIFSTFSFFLLLIVLLYLILISLINPITIIKSIYIRNFRMQLQFVSIVMVVLSIGIGAGIAIETFIKHYNNKHKEFYREKSYSILFELENIYGDAPNLQTISSSFLQQHFQRLNYTHFVDVNLFTTKGKLYATSRPQIYQNGIISNYINPKALLTLQYNPTIFYLIDETIGSLSYISAYLPLLNRQNKLLGYIQIPFFTQKSDLQREIFAFLNTFINIYVLLLAIAIILAVLLANYITLPLRVIGEKIRSIRPGQANEKIIWKSDDDIGALIEQYNKMIDELSYSMQQLLQSEREQAWQQMAKQIAHEIKNPLTPMKLTLQNLMRLHSENYDEFAKRFSSLSSVMIEQIEALTKIANTFSEYAGLSQDTKKNIEMKKFIEKILPLYQHFRATIYLTYDNDTDYNVLAGETQLMQVFNNLIRNAIEAVQKTENPTIHVHLTKENNKLIVVSIEDNGTGIAEDIKSYIFQPHFTSKSGGTGLGLAITRQIIHSLGGNIWFKTTEQKGTTFYFTLPVNTAT